MKEKGLKIIKTRWKLATSKSMKASKVRDWKPMVLIMKKNWIKARKWKLNHGKTMNVCKECDKINMISVHAETRHEALVEQLKDKLCRVIFTNQEE